MTIKHVILFIALCLFTWSAAAQDVQIPIYEPTNLQTIDAELERKLNLFSTYPNFIEARLYHLDDATYSLEILYKQGDVIHRSRISMTEEDVEAFRQTILKSLQSESPRLTVDQSGRAQLVAGTTILSLAYYSWAVPKALNITDSRGSIGLGLLVAGAGFYAPFTASKNAHVSRGAAHLSIYGGSRGIGHGILTTFLFTDDPTDPQLLFPGIIVGIGEGFLGYQLANRHNLSFGTTRMIGISGDIGVGMGAGTAALASLYKNHEAELAATFLIGSAVGLWGGYQLSQQQPYSIGDAEFTGSLSIYTAYTGAVLAELMGAQSEKTFALVSMLGALGGLATGHSYTRNLNFSAGQARLISLSGLAGALISSGIVYVIIPENEDPTAYLTASAVGLMTGFYLMYNRQKQRVDYSDAQADNLRFSLRPEGIALWATNRRTDRMQAPLFSIQYKW